MRVVSVLHPSDSRLPTLVSARPGGHQIIVPSGQTGPGTVPLTVRGGSRWGRSRLARYAGLRAVFAETDVVHLRCDPASALAYQVARLCQSSSVKPILLLETNHRSGQHLNFMWRCVARRVLARVDAAVVPHAEGLISLRSLGFGGAGLIGGAAAGLLAKRPARTGRLTLGLAASFSGAAGGATDVLEAVAASPSVHIVAAETAGHHRLSDRAAALEMHDRIRFVPAGQVLLECDILAVVPHPRAAFRLPYDTLIATAQANGVPVLCSNVAGLAEMTGAGGWVVPPGDAGAIFEVLRKLRADRGMLDDCAQKAITHERARHLDVLSGSVLHRAMEHASFTRLRKIAAADRTTQRQSDPVQP